jgi:hypothetical protein
VRRVRRVQRWRSLTLVPALGVAALVTACGQSVVKPNATEKYVSDLVFQQTGFRPVDVRCPSGVPAKEGGTLNCHFTGPEGPYTAYLRIVKVEGDRVAFTGRTQPSRWPPPKQF